ncbi:uncharacterized protein VTP21DRAFT_470 [Calcarisporiella thermophila]|uniref:uncharacterized protein n=1 Tax=Calcarisporiella thermophila TaxID=911321 RepID=UPI0037420B7F
MRAMQYRLLSCRHFSSATSGAYNKRLQLFGWGDITGLPSVQSHNARQGVIWTPKQLRVPGLEQEGSHRLHRIASGWAHSLIAMSVKGKSVVYGCGLNNSGQLGIGDISKQGPTEGFVKNLPMNARVLDMACGREHSLVLSKMENGETKLFGFGSEMYGQLGSSRSKYDLPEGADTSVASESSTPITVDGGKQVVAVACGLDHSVLLTDDHCVYAMGWGADGQVGTGPGSTSDKNTPTPVYGMNGRPVRKLTSSTDFTFCLMEDGSLWTWGNSEYGQCMLGRKIDRILEPVKVHFEKNILDVAAGGPFSLVLTDEGRIYTCGYGALGLGDEVIETLKPTLVKGIEDRVVKIYATTDYAAAITEAGQLFTWGLGGWSGRLGHGGTDHAFVPRLVRFQEEKEVCVHDVALGIRHVLALCEL